MVYHDQTNESTTWCKQINKRDKNNEMKSIQIVLVSVLISIRVNVYMVTMDK